MQRLELSAPAKVNLGLRIVGRRSDGYHLLESLFVPLELADHVRLEVERGPAGASGPRVELSLAAVEPGLATVPTDDTNLALRAAHAFLADAGPEAGVASLEIELSKRIPSAAGLGGGSSDAAAVLRGLARLAESPALDLHRIAASLGADVPFFLDPRPSLVQGIGERLGPVQGLPALDVVLVNPGAPLGTPEVFRLYDELSGAESALTPEGPGPTLRALSGLGDDPNALTRVLACANDLEAAAVHLCPAIASLLDRLRALGALGAGMSGSGATVWGVFDSASAAREAHGALAVGLSEGAWSCVTRTAGS